MPQGSPDNKEWKRFETMLLMRRFEETVMDLHAKSEFIGHFHVYIGQEATGAAAMDTLRSGDHIVTTHRNHGHIIARGADPGAALAEILGRSTGLNRGYGGTFHLCEPSLGFLSTSGVVGGAISLAIGGGYACKQRGDGSVTATFFGDGALEEGIAFESLNLAALWKLPVVFICENNDGQLWTGEKGQASSQEHATRDLCDIPRVFGIETQSIAGLDATEVEATVARAVARCREGRGPAFIEVKTNRWPGNLTQWPTPATGATDLRMATGEAAIPADHRPWFERDDPVLRAARALSGIDPRRVAKIDEAVAARVAAALDFALKSPRPAPAQALDHVFA